MDKINIQWETIVQGLDKNKEALIPIVVFTTLGGLFFVCRRKIFRAEQSSIESHQRQPLNILNLPPETRKCIWDQLCYRDILQLRLVCEDFKNDVDTRVGVNGHLNNLSDNQRFSFFTNIVLKKCLITDLQDFSEGKIFASPYHLQHLSIYERTSLSLETLHNILWDCNNVQQLLMRFSNFPEGTRVTTDLSRIILNSLQTKSQLKEFQFVKIPSYHRTDKSIPRDISHLSFTVSNQLTYVDIQIPDVLPGHLAEWKYFIEQQSKLSTLIADFGGIYWKFFSKTISKNRETLKNICLYQLRHTDDNSRQESSFDWGLFRHCSKLEILQITGFKFILEPMPSINFSTVPVTNLLELCIRRVALSREDVKRIYQQMPILRSGSFENMGTEGDTAAIELMMENRQMEIDREIEEWEGTQRHIEIFSDCLFYTCAVAVIGAYVAIFYRYYHMENSFEHPDKYMK